MRTIEERRGCTRVPVPADSSGRLGIVVEVKILDISARGFQMESRSPLRPGTHYQLNAVLPGMKLAARIRIVRCRFEQRGRTALLYRAGAEFLEVTEGAENLDTWLSVCLPGERGDSGHHAAITPIEKGVVTG